jgi:hypothetical protein
VTDPRPRRTGTIFRYVPAKSGEKQGHYVVRYSETRLTPSWIQVPGGVPGAREPALCYRTFLSNLEWVDGDSNPGPMD